MSDRPDESSSQFSPDDDGGDPQSDGAPSSEAASSEISSSEMSTPESAAELTSAGSPKEESVSLGPACLVVVIVGLLIFSIGMVAVSVYLMSNQSMRAASAIRENLIPWVEESSLEPADRQGIIDELEVLIIDLENERLDSRQLTRLKYRLEDQPMHQWGVIQGIVAKLPETGLTEQEQTAVRQESNRLLRTASEGRLGMPKMEFVLQPVATKDMSTASERLTLKPDVTDSEIREYLTRAKNVSDKSEITTKPYTKSLVEAYRGLIDDAKAENNDS
jgi:hypothetical protein